MLNLNINNRAEILLPNHYSYHGTPWNWSFLKKAQYFVFIRGNQIDFTNRVEKPFFLFYLKYEAQYDTSISISLFIQNWCDCTAYKKC